MSKEEEKSEKKVSKNEDKQAKQINDNLLGERFVKFGNRFIHMPSLIKGFMSIRTSGGKYIKNRPMRSISRELKEIFLDIIYKNNFESAKYDKLSPEEQEYFDELCRYTRMSTHSIEKRISITEKQKNELLGQFNVLKGELLSGNDSPDIIKKMRNILLELGAKQLIPKQHYNLLLSEIVACL